MEGSPFVGHGAFGILTKQGWVPDFGVYGIPEVWALWIGFQWFLRAQGSPLRGAAAPKLAAPCLGVGCVAHMRAPSSEPPFP
jgi:hypothetical protein